MTRFAVLAPVGTSSAVMRSLSLVLLLWPALAMADDKPSAAEPQKKRVLSMDELRKFYSDENDRIITDWVEAGGVPKVYSALAKAGYVAVLAEGKTENGQYFCRYHFKHPADVYPDGAELGWACYNCMSQASFDDKKRSLEEKGYTLMQVRSSEVDDGVPRFNAVWVRAAGPNLKKKE
jgi:hypothetical protein